MGACPGLLSIAPDGAGWADLNLPTSGWRTLLTRQMLAFALEERDVYRCRRQPLLKLRQERHHDMPPRPGLALMSHSAALHISSLTGLGNSPAANG
jgi:hypothetical protein